MVKKFEGVGKPRLAATTSLFGLLGSQDEFLDPTGAKMYARSEKIVYRAS
jgi:hypothetical protein